MNGPLSGIRIVELCTWFTGPMTACILADQGAEVIKVEPPGGDPFRISGTSRAGFGAMFLAANRNKRSIELDLKKDSDKEIALQLIARADVILQNARSGSMKRLGLDAETLCARFPRLIYASISGFGSSGPIADQGAFDPIIQVMSGLATVQGDAGRPALVRTMVADKTVPLVMAQAIACALFQRERTGKGCTLEGAMLDAMVWWMWPDAMMNQTFVGGGETRGTDIAVANSISATSDGFLSVSPHQEKDWQAFIDVVGRPELRTDSRFASARDRMLNLVDYYAEVRASFAGKTTEQWCALLREKGVPCAPVLSREQVIQDPQVVWNKMIEEVNHPAAGAYLSVRQSVKFDGVAGGIRSAAPDIGQHRAEILSEIGVGKAVS